jgi:RimJ/RimL family protein N-acetyltransferase
MFSLRAIEEEDLEFIREIRNDKDLYQFLGTFEIISKRKQIKWFESLQNDDSKMYLIFEKYGFDEEEKKQNPLPNIRKKLGYVRVTQIDKINMSICVGGDIQKGYRGKGYGKEMYKLIFDLCFNKLNMNRVWLFVLENNERAINLYTKMGFKEEGRQRKAIFKNGNYFDYVMMSILKDEYKL